MCKLITLSVAVAVFTCILSSPLLRDTSAVCDVAEPCEPPLATFSYFELGSLPRIVWYLITKARLSEADAARREAAVGGRLKGGAAPVVVNVGVNTLKKELELYRSLFVPLERYRFVFVEPNQLVLPTLEEQIKELGVDRGHVQIVNAAVCPDSGDHMKMYRVNKSLEERLPRAAYETMVEMTSLDIERIKRSFDRWLILAPVSLDELMSYVEEAPVRCLSPSDLLREVGVEPEAVGFYSCDAEGYDSQLTKMFLGLPSFKPAVVQFEWAWHHDHNTTKMELIAEVVRSLHGRGYNIAKDGDEIVAVHSAP